MRDSRSKLPHCHAHHVRVSHVDNKVHVIIIIILVLIVININVERAQPTVKTNRCGQIFADIARRASPTVNARARPQVGVNFAKSINSDRNCQTYSHRRASHTLHTTSSATRSPFRHQSFLIKDETREKNSPTVVSTYYTCTTARQETFAATW